MIVTFMYANDHNGKLPPKGHAQSRVPNIWEHDESTPSLTDYFANGYMEIIAEDNPLFHCPSQPFKNVISPDNGNWKIYDYSYFGNQHLAGNRTNGPSDGWVDYPTGLSSPGETPLFADGVELYNNIYQHNNHGYSSPRRTGEQVESLFEGMNQVHMDGSGKWFNREKTEISKTTQWGAQIFWGYNN